MAAPNPVIVKLCQPCMRYEPCYTKDYTCPHYVEPSSPTKKMKTTQAVVDMKIDIRANKREERKEWKKDANSIKVETVTRSLAVFTEFISNNVHTHPERVKRLLTYIEKIDSEEFDSDNEFENALYASETKEELGVRARMQSEWVDMEYPLSGSVYSDICLCRTGAACWYRTHIERMSELSLFQLRGTSVYLCDKCFKLKQYERLVFD